MKRCKYGLKPGTMVSGHNNKFSILSGRKRGWRLINNLGGYFTGLNKRRPSHTKITKRIASQ